MSIDQAGTANSQLVRDAGNERSEVEIVLDEQERIVGAFENLLKGLSDKLVSVLLPPTPKNSGNEKLDREYRTALAQILKDKNERLKNTIAWLEDIKERIQL